MGANGHQGLSLSPASLARMRPEPVRVELIEKSIVERLTPSYEDQRRRQGAVLANLTERAMGSALYKGRVHRIDDLDKLGELPLTSYETVAGSVEEKGLKSVVLDDVERFYHTSGSTGEPKRIYYSRQDLLEIALEYAMFGRVIGTTTDMVGWNFGGAAPLVSGDTLDDVMSLFAIRKDVSTLLRNDADLIKALRTISKERDVDLMAGAALVFYLIGRIAREPRFLHGIVRNKLQRDMHLPGTISDLVAKVYLRGVDLGALDNIVKNVRIGISYAEPLSHYMNEIRADYPRLAIYDVYGSTENPLIAAQMSQGAVGLSLFINSIIPEIADPTLVVEAKADPTRPMPAVPWTEWKQGMRGELIITRPGSCMPLIRYPTGDVIEVLEPAHETNVRLGMGDVRIVLPLIRILGRSVDVLDFEVQDESGNFLGNKIYSRHISEALQRSHNVRWWELYNVKGDPGRLVFLIIPERPVESEAAFRKEMLRHLLKECDDVLHTLQVATDLGRLEVMITRPEAYTIVQREIDKRIKEGRSLGQLKPKHIFIVDGEDEFTRTVDPKLAR